MSKQTINLGTIPTGAGGDTPRSAFTKTEANIIELYGALGATGSPLAIPVALPITKGGTGSSSQAGARTALGLKTGAITDVIGTVATGAIMEVGSNANGTFVKFLNGQAIVKVAPFNWTVTANALTIRDVLLPMDFAGDYQIMVSGVPMVSNDQYGYVSSYSNGPYTAGVVHRNGPNAQVMVTRLTILGYWKYV